MIRDADRARNRLDLGMWIALASFLAFAVTLYVGGYAPYLVTAHSVHVRTYIVFPVLVAGFLGLYLLIRAKAEDRIHVLFDGDGSGRWQRLRTDVLTILGLLVTAAALAGMSYVVPSVATFALADRPFARLYRVGDVRGSTVSRRVLHLQPARDPWEEAWLRTRWIHVEHISPGDIVCVRGREWPLGSVATQVTRNPEACRGQAAAVR